MNRENKRESLECGNKLFRGQNRESESSQVNPLPKFSHFAFKTLR